ncbi:MAG: FAD-dependent monooxygenase [Gammaproteobacteria bacterium]
MALENTPESVVVVGAGIGGLTLAALLSSQGVSVDVVEQAAKPGDVGAGIQLGPNAMHVLSALGLGPALAELGFAPQDAILRQFNTGKPLLKTGLNPLHQERYGQPYLHVHRADLHAALLEIALAFKARLHFGQKTIAIHREPGLVRLDCESGSFIGDVLAGADGVHSMVRESVVNQSSPTPGPQLSANALFTGQTAWRGLVPAHRLPKGLISPDANVWLGPGKHFVAYYVRGGTLINFVAVREKDSWTEESWHQKGDVEELRSSFSGWDSAVTQLLDACGECHYWGLFDRPRLDCWYHERVVLLGDACHPMLPFMAQGAAMAIEDAWVLGTRLNDTRLSLDQSLEVYQRERLARTSLMQKRSSDNAELYHRSKPVGVALRNMSFKIATAIPGVTHSVLDSIYGLNVTQLD